jgi:GT2 family glycosyltransferase
MLEVCMVTYEGEELIERAVRSLAQLWSGVGLAIHDNSPTPLALSGVRSVAAELGIPLRVERCGGNCGFASACNSLVNGSGADYVLFLNPDAELLNWPGEHLLASNAIVGPVVTDESGRILATWGTRRSILEEFMQRWARARPRMPLGRGYVSGAAFLIPRAIFIGLGGFDETFFMYYEDIDLCLRANESGILVKVEPRWRVRHVGGHAANADRAGALIRSYDAATYFFAKHGRNVQLYRFLCRIDANIKLALYRLVPGRRSWVPAIRQLREHLAKG